MKNLIIAVLLFTCSNLFSDIKLPFIIETEEKVFHRIASEINSKLPKKVDILVCNILFLNGNPEVTDKINKNFNIILDTQQFVYKYTVESIDNVKLKDETSNYSFIQNYDEQELIAFAQFLNKDALLISSVTILEDQKKRIWDFETLKFIDKNIALFQGNIFNTETKDIMLRFYYYFLID
jgi:hypothetical protein